MSKAEIMVRTELPRIITEELPGPKAKKIIERRGKSVPSAIRCVYPVVIEKGEGAMIEDVDGNYFLDWIGGVGVLNIGFSHPEVVEAVKEHQEKSRAGAEQKFKGGLASTGEMETKYHTATHLLNAALKQVLGSHVHQRGSNITADRMRFDFSHPAKMTDEEKQKTEDLVNEWITEAIPVEHVERK